MADDKPGILPHDAARIDITMPHELSYWSRQFECTSAELMRVIRKVGTSARMVEHELRGGSRRAVEWISH